MKCQYESEILYKLMERDGFNIPSSVPPYESEIKAYLINQVKQAYPKLTDYEAEWLLYNYTKHLPADFPISSATNVVKATFENVVPFAYQSAILKGQTLVNLFNKSQDSYTIEPDKNIVFKSDLYKTSTTYLIKFDVVSSNTNNNLMLQYYLNGQWLANYELNIKLGINKFVITSISNQFDTIRLYYNSLYGSETVKLKNIMLIEYQQGMENWDIPYFEGIQSVKMPALTTTGKNLCGELEQGTISSSGGTLTASNTRLRTTNFITLPPGTYTVSINSSFDWVYRMFDVNGKFLSASTDWNSAIPTITETRKIKLVIKRKDNLSLSPTDSVEIQLEQGTQSTSYEPYKSNILSCNEEVELRGIGDVQDTLDLMTGEVVESTIKGVLDGSENWGMWNDRGESSNIISFYFDIKNVPNKNNIVINDKFATYDGTNESHPYYSTAKETIMIAYGTAFGTRFCVGISKEKATNLSEFKAWLSSNNINYIVEANEKARKTVGLTTVNEKGESVYFIPLEGTMNVQSSGEIIQPTFDMSVPVEATTQNLASFIDLEME